jgi:hypothetical protein
MRIAAITLASALLGAASARGAGGHPLDRAAEVVAEVAPLVEKACGAKFETPPGVVELPDETAAEVFAQDLRPEFDRRYAELSLPQRAGLLRISAIGSLRSCLARYSFSTRKIVVVRSGFDAQCAAMKATGDRAVELLRVSLAHECVHALDDARFDLSKIYRSAADDEAVRAIAMIAEGRAVHFGRIAAAEAGAPPDLVDLLPGGPTPKTEREWHVHLTYRLGARFVGDLAARGGLGLAEKALREPPGTTWSICVPSRRPEGPPDERPAAVLARAEPAATARTLSDLQLRERYAALLGLEAAEKLLEPVRGGAQALVDGTNSAVLAFADESAAKRFEELSRDEAPTVRRGTLVARALGVGQEAALARLTAALDQPPLEKK